MAGMTKRHFEAHARIINEAMNDRDLDRQTVLYIAARMADYYEEENPLFNRVRFSIACCMTEQP
jgi:hypothetical protein